MQPDFEHIYSKLRGIRHTRIPSAGEHIHSVVFTDATYSPWWEDQLFQIAHTSINGKTLVDMYRCYELWSLVGQMGSVLGDILEVGVWRGGTGCLMAARTMTLPTRKKVFLCDTFSGVVKASEKDPTYNGGEHADTSMTDVGDLAGRMGLDNVELLQGIFPDETGSRIEDRAFSLCHIDVDVYDSARDIMNWVWPRLSLGGCVVFDDYGFWSCEGVTRFVNEIRSKTGALFLHNLNGHALFVKTVP